MRPEDEFGYELEGVLEPFKEAVIELAEALKRNSAKVETEIEYYRVAADRAIHSVVGADHKEVLFDYIDKWQKSRPDLKDQFEYIKSNIVI
jgi:hypothetical protein